MTEKNVQIGMSTVKVNIAKRSYMSVVWGRLKKNKVAMFFLAVIVLLILLAIFGPMISPYDYSTLDYTSLYQPPSAAHWMGTDDSGRDMFTLILYGLRNAFIVGFGAGIVELCIGLILGASAGYFGGRVDNILMRITDIMFGFPVFLFNIMLVMLLGRGIFTIFIAIGITSWTNMARLVRGQVLTLKQSDFIEAGRAMGASNARIIFKYIIPNSVGPLIVALSFSIPNAMFAEAGMSLIGMGVMPPMPSWGALISRGTAYILSSPYMILYPALSFAITVLSFSYLGDGLRDAFDPKHNR